MTDAHSQKKILLVDDDKFLLDMYGMKFTQAGYAVQVCLSVKDALKALREGFAADALVFDIVMPEADGFAFLEAVRAEKLAPDAVRVALTNQSDDDEKKRAEDFGIDEYIIKASMIPSEVVEAVGKALAKGKR